MQTKFLQELKLKITKLIFRINKQTNFNFIKFLLLNILTAIINEISALFFQNRISFS